VSPIRAILFDADGVIQRGNAERFFGIAREVYGAGRDGFDEFMQAVYEAELPAAIGACDFAEALAPVLQRWTCPGTVAQFLPAWDQIDLLPGGLETVAAMRRRGYLCCLATNQQAHRMRRMREDLGYHRHFDREFYSCELGHRKPDGAYFEAILAALDLEPAATLFIDDAQANVDAAAGLGIHAAFFPGGDLLSFVEQRL
jgi:putative hydrolase of the HAD superfamily